MQFGVILNALSVIVPGVIAGSKKIIKGNEKYFVAIGLYFFFQFLVRKYAGEAISKSIQDNPNAGAVQNSEALAMAYRNAMNPSGFSYLDFADGTNELELMRLAAETHDYRKVYNAYMIKYKRDLTDDLRAELSDEDYQRFLSILNS